MPTFTTIVLTEAEPKKQTTERDKQYTTDGRIFQINVESLDANGDVIANTGQLTGKWRGVGSGTWDDFVAAYELDGSGGGGWNMNAFAADAFEFDGTGSIPAGGSIVVSIGDWNQ